MKLSNPSPNFSMARLIAALWIFFGLCSRATRGLAAAIASTISLRPVGAAAVGDDDLHVEPLGRRAQPVDQRFDVLASFEARDHHQARLVQRGVSR